LRFSFQPLELLPTRAGGLRKVQQAVTQAGELFGKESVHSLGGTRIGRADGNRVQVIADPDGRPRVLFLGNRRERVREISNRWRVQEEWWRREVQREYYRIITEAGRLCLIYKDTLGGGWYVERVYG
ncbi:MAG TPA: hypothetical protein VHS28_10255, partial [Chloroflexota bacterium]|nr:hypothetical protein [Chloroflexota bacterium]